MSWYLALQHQEGSAMQMVKAMRIRRKRFPDSVRLRNIPLRDRILSFILISSLLSFLCVAAVSWYAISSLQGNKIQVGIKSNLKQIMLSLENSISNLNNVSQQLSYYGPVGKRFEVYLLAKAAFEKIQIIREMKQELSFIEFTNPNIGFIAYVLRDSEEWLFNGMPIREGFTLETLPLLSEYSKIAYYGPHRSADRFNDQFVLSALRKVDVPGFEDAFVYIESGFKVTQRILDADRSSLHTTHLMLDNAGRIAFSEQDDRFPVNTFFNHSNSSLDPDGSTRSGTAPDYYWVQSFSSQGWSIVSLVPKSVYDHERNLWIVQMILLSCLSLLLSLIVGKVLWNMVYRPLDRFGKEIGWITANDLHAEIVPIHIPEFDRLLEQFHEMKQQVIDLIAEVRSKEKRRANLEIEKLRYQINPHFLMNTLNTAHWIALMNDQREIDRILMSLNRLLSYNLGKNSDEGTLKGELDALAEYVSLQQNRYQFRYELEIESPPEMLDLPLPRFILQPLVENALFHGLSEGGSIRVRVSGSGPVLIEVYDNGSGMTKETIRILLEDMQPDHDKVGMGIGMSYVWRILQARYDGESTMAIDSEPGKGTTVTLLLPISGDVPC